MAHIALNETQGDLLLLAFKPFSNQLQENSDKEANVVLCDQTPDRHNKAFPHIHLYAPFNCRTKNYWEQTWQNGPINEL